jgi:hypothetical protein
VIVSLPRALRVNGVAVSGPSRVRVPRAGYAPLLAPVRPGITALDVLVLAFVVAVGWTARRKRLADEFAPALGLAVTLAGTRLLHGPFAALLRGATPSPLVARTLALAVLITVLGMVGWAVAKAAAPRIERWRRAHRSGLAEARLGGMLRMVHAIVLVAMLLSLVAGPAWSGDAVARSLTGRGLVAAWRSVVGLT